LLAVALLNFWHPALPGCVVHHLLQVLCSPVSVSVTFQGFRDPEYTGFELGSGGFDVCHLFPMMDVAVSASVMGYNNVTCHRSYYIFYELCRTCEAYSLCTQSVWLDEEKAEFISRFHWDFIISV